MATAPHDVRGRWLSSLGARAAPPSRFSRGIATIELAAVVALTLVMVAVAISAYRTYSARREVRASVSALNQVQDLVTSVFGRTGVPPSSEADLPMLEPAARRYIDAVTIEHGRIVIRFGDDADESLRGRSLSVSPFETMDGEVSWLCGSHPAGVGLYPLGFMSGTPPLPHAPTTVDSRYLPPECR